MVEPSVEIIYANVLDKGLVERVNLLKIFQIRVKHYDWIFQVMWFVFTNKSAFYIEE